MNGPWTDIRVDWGIGVGTRQFWNRRRHRLVRGDSGKDGAECVVYEYVIVNDEAWASFVLNCPEDEDTRFRSIVVRMESSLSLPKGE